MTLKYRICLAEDHTLLRAGIISLLSSNPNFDIIAEVSDGLELLAALKIDCPDLVIMDLSMPRMRGMEAIKEIKNRYAEAIKILVLTMHDTEEYILAALQAGALGYILKDATPEEFMLAITTVLKGKTYLSPDVSGKVLRGYLEGKQTETASSSWETITHREREVLKLVAEGSKNKDIAELLHMSVKTVETHRTNLMKKLNVHSATELTVYAMENGLVTR